MKVERRLVQPQFSQFYSHFSVFFLLITQKMLSPTVMEQLLHFLILHFICIIIINQAATVNQLHHFLTEQRVLPWMSSLKVQYRFLYLLRMRKALLLAKSSNWMRQFIPYLQSHRVSEH